MTKNNFRNNKYALFFSFAILFISFLFLSTDTSAQIPPRPNPPKLVNDFANIIPHGQERRLEQKLVIYNDSTSTQLTVVTLSSLNGDEPYSVAHQILETWGVGQKGKDNGIVVLIAPNERRTFISTGYGVEATLTDALSKRIVENYMLPSFREGNYAKGVDQATDVIFGIMSGQYHADEIGPQIDPTIFIFIAFVIFFFFILPIILDVMNRKNGKRGRGYTYSERGPFGGTIIIHSGDDFGDFSSGSGSFGGGSFGGGGFGGFGGGSGGGGGAGGSW